MNNIGALIDGSISIIKNSSLFIATILSLFSTTTPSTSSNNPNQINLGVSDSAKKQAIENTNKIIGVLNQDNLTTSIFVSTSTKKLNALNLVAPEYKNISTDIVNITSKNKKNKTRDIIGTSTTNQVGVSNSNTLENNAVFITQRSSDDSVVNIRCENKISNTLKVVTGSGVLISSSGLILTAAHVAAPVYAKQMGNNSYACVARIKNPATGSYPLKVVFIDPTWVSKYYSMFDKTYSETGENDLALLQIDSGSSTKISGNDTTKLNSASYAILNSTSVDVDNPISIKAYPSDIYGKFGVFASLPRQSETNSIEGLFNFNSSASAHYDLLETNPSSLGQSGASGGGIFNDQGQLIGIISNMVSSDILLQNKIRALSISYIDKQVKSGLGVSIFEYNK